MSIEDFIIDESDGDDEARRLLDEQREKAQAMKQGIYFYVKPFIQWLVYLAVNPDCKQSPGSDSALGKWLTIG